MFTGALLLGGFVLLVYIARQVRKTRIAAETMVGGLLLLGMADTDREPIKVVVNDDKPFKTTA